MNVWARSLHFQPYTFDKTVEGVTFRFHVATPTGDAWYGRQTGQSSLEMGFVRDQLLRRGDTILEIGGHHGKDTVLLSKWVGVEGRVITFEPMPDNVEVISQNVSLNQLGNVEVVPIALGDSVGTANMRRKSNSAVKAQGRGGTVVTMSTVDNYCEEHGLTPDLLKVDVEGFELSVLAGAQKTLAESRPSLQIELHCDILGRYDATPEDIWNVIDRDEYHVWIQRTDQHVPVPYDGAEPLIGRVHLFMKPRETNDSCD